MDPDYRRQHPEEAKKQAKDFMKYNQLANGYRSAYEKVQKDYATKSMAGIASSVVTKGYNFLKKLKKSK